MRTEQLVFLDEAGAKTNMTRLRGRAPRGARVHDHAPHGHWCTTTLVSSIRLDGTTACMALEGPINAEAFIAYVRECLAPALNPGDVVVLDNLSSHKAPEVIACLAEVGARALFLPAYSPDLNPIEKMWSKLKEFLRAAKARTQDALLQAVAAGLATITCGDARGWFASCGYTIS